MAKETYQLAIHLVVNGELEELKKLYDLIFDLASDNPDVDLVEVGGGISVREASDGQKDA